MTTALVVVVCMGRAWLSTPTGPHSGETARARLAQGGSEPFVTSPALAFSDPTTGDRYYRDPLDGAIFPSVTTVIGLARYERLERWKLRMVAQAAVDQAGDLSERLQTEGRRELVRRLAAAPDDFAEQRARIGDEVHNWLEARSKGETAPELTQEAAAFAPAAGDFLATLAPRWLAAEATCFNRRVGYAGTADFLAGIGLLTVVGDYKTGREAHTAVALQLAALAHAEELVLPDGTRRPMPGVDCGMVVTVRPDGFLPRLVDVGDGPWRAFRALVAAREELAGAARWLGPAVASVEAIGPAYERFCATKGYGRTQRGDGAGPAG